MTRTCRYCYGKGWYFFHFGIDKYPSTQSPCDRCGGDGIEKPSYRCALDRWLALKPPRAVKK